MNTLDKKFHDALCQRLLDLKWTWGDKDPMALAVLEQRIAERCRLWGLLTYSHFVKGVDFHLPNVLNGRAYRISIYDWDGFNRGLVGDFLGYISTRSYLAHGFMASALVVDRKEHKPSRSFFDWMVELQVLPDTTPNTVLKFWTDQVREAHNWYRTNP